VVAVILAIMPARLRPATLHQNLFDYVPRLIEELVEALALGVEQLCDKNARAVRFGFDTRRRTRLAELLRDGGDRDTGKRAASPRSSQTKNQLRRFEPGVVIRTAVNDHASHHKDLARSKRVFDYVQRLIEELVQALALGVEQLRNDDARAERVRFPARQRA
jgi:hypothetical protein